MNIAARKTPSSVCDWMRQAHGERLPVRVREHEQRPEEVLPRREHREHRDDPEDRLRHRQHDRDQNSRNGPAPSIARRLEDLARQVVEEALHEDDVERARAGRQPDRPVAVDERVVDERRVARSRCRAARAARPPARTASRAGARRRSPRTAAAAPTARSRRSSRRRSATSQEPNASTTVFQKYRPTCTVVQASLRLLQADAVREERHRLAERVDASA